MFQITPEYIQKIKKYIKKQENWNRRLRKQLLKLTGVSTLSFIDLFYVGFFCVRCAMHDYYNMNSVDTSGAHQQKVFF